MKESIVRVQKAAVKGKKYTATLRNKQSGKTRVVHFGAIGYGQYRDSTRLGLYRNLDHGDQKRRRSYFLRHSGVATKSAALEKESRTGLYTPKLLAHKFLW